MADEVAQRPAVYVGRRIRVEEVPVTGPTGTATREVVRHPGSVVVLPIIDGPDGEEVVVIRQYRAAIDAELLELVAGTMEPPEPPDACARRELMEEAGYRCGRLESLGSFLPLPGLSDERMHLFVARDLEPVGQSLDAGEVITVERLPLEALLAQASELDDGKTMVALLRYTLSR